MKKEMIKGEVEFDCMVNDLFWSAYEFVHTKEGTECFKLRWRGYNDDYWWSNVAEKNRLLKCVGDKGTVKYFELDYSTNEYTEVEQQYYEEMMNKKD